MLNNLETFLQENPSYTLDDILIIITKIDLFLENIPNKEEFLI